MVEASINGIVNCLKFTVETGMDFEDSWLPTLDLSLKVDEENTILYCFYEKPTSSEVCLQADTALSQNSILPPS